MKLYMWNTKKTKKNSEMTWTPDSDWKQQATSLHYAGPSVRYGTPSGLYSAGPGTPARVGRHGPGQAIWAPPGRWAWPGPRSQGGGAHEREGRDPGRQSAQRGSSAICPNLQLWMCACPSCHFCTCNCQHSSASVVACFPSQRPSDSSNECPLQPRSMMALAVGVIWSDTTRDDKTRRREAAGWWLCSSFFSFCFSPFFWFAPLCLSDSISAVRWDSSGGSLHCGRVCSGVCTDVLLSYVEFHYIWSTLVSEFFFYC